MKIKLKRSLTTIELDSLIIENYIMEILAKTPGVVGLGNTLTAKLPKNLNVKDVILGYRRGIKGVKVTTDSRGMLKVEAYVIILDSINVLNVSEHIQEDIIYFLKKDFAIDRENIKSVDVYIKGLKIN